MLSRMSDPDQRRRDILGVVQRSGFVTIDALAGQFGVTLQTIRRDVNELGEQGLVRRHHGGVARLSSTENISYDVRRHEAAEAKRRIARLVAEHIPDGASLFINIGTTTEEVARALKARERLRVITNNLNVAMILHEKPDFEVLVAGGVVRNRDGGIIGEAAIEFIQQFRSDFAIIGTSGIEPDGTLMDFDYREVRVAQAIIAHARQVFLVADHTKFGRNAMVRLAAAGAISAVFTDRDPPEPYRGSLLAAGAAIHVAPDDRAA